MGETHQLGPTCRRPSCEAQPTQVQILQVGEGAAEASQQACWPRQCIIGKGQPLQGFEGSLLLEDLDDWPKGPCQQQGISVPCSYSCCAACMFVAEHDDRGCMR